MVLVPGLIPPPCRHYRVRCSGCLRTSDPDLRSYTPYIRPSHYHRWVVRAVALRDAAPAPPPPLTVTVVLYAPMLCVMPPASPAATRDLRMKSSRLVLPEGGAGGGAKRGSKDEVKLAGIAWKGEGRGRRGVQRMKSTGWYCLRGRKSIA